MKASLERLWGWLALAGFIIIPAGLFLAVFIQYRLATFKQAAMNLARFSLSAALGDLPNVGLEGFGYKTNALPGRLYGNFWIFAYTNTVVAGGRKYSCVLATSQWDNEWYTQGRLAVTTNGDFIWLDYHRAPKIIPADYQVSKWRTGY